MQPVRFVIQNLLFACRYQNHVTQTDTIHPSRVPECKKGPKNNLLCSLASRFSERCHILFCLVNIIKGYKSMKLTKISLSIYPFSIIASRLERGAAWQNSVWSMQMCGSMIGCCTSTASALFMNHHKACLEYINDSTFHLPLWSICE